jgi:hypothetical protein
MQPASQYQEQYNDVVLLRPLPFRDAEHLMLFEDHAGRRDTIGMMRRNIELPVQAGWLNDTEVASNECMPGLGIRGGGGAAGVRDGYARIAGGLAKGTCLFSSR